MSELLATAALLALYLVPVGGLWWLYRVYLRRRARRAEAPPAPREVPVAGQHFSFPLGLPFVVYPLLMWGIVRGEARWWGWIFQAAYLGLVGVFLWEGLSRKAFETAHAKDAALSRATWILNWILFFVVLPGVGWAVAMVALAGR